MNSGFDFKLKAFVLLTQKIYNYDFAKIRMLSGYPLSKNL
tara:strand:- start:354 stop:473 length:120 start_codon:yes stop_codon:yes gene_type:complete